MAKFPALPLSVEEESKNRGQRIGRPPISQLEKVGVFFLLARREHGFWLIVNIFSRFPKLHSLLARICWGTFQGRAMKLT